MQNPYQATTSELELVETRKPRTTQAFRVAIWVLASVTVFYPLLMSAIDFAVQTDYGRNTLYKYPITQRIWEMLAN